MGWIAAIGQGLSGDAVLDGGGPGQGATSVGSAKQQQEFSQDASPGFVL